MIIQIIGRGKRAAADLYIGRSAELIVGKAVDRAAGRGYILQRAVGVISIEHGAVSARDREHAVGIGVVGVGRGVACGVGNGT